MATISALMEGKKPGEIKVRNVQWLKWEDDRHFVPFFSSGGTVWHGLDAEGAAEWFCVPDGWELYQEKPKMVVLYEWMYRVGGEWELSNTLRSEERAAIDFGNFLYKKTDRKFEVPG